MSEPAKASKISGIKVALAVIPALLIISICIALYLGATADQEESQPYEGEVTVEEMAGYLENLNEVIGERRLDTEAGQRAFRQINAMTMGALGPQNLGYETFRSQKDSVNGLLWSTIWITAGDRDAKEVVVVAIPQAGSGTGPAFGFGFAEYLASHQTEFAIRLVFYPPLVEGSFEDWIWNRCGGEGEQLKGMVKITGGDPVERVTVFRGPEGLGGILREMRDSKLWHEGMKVDEEAAPFFEIQLVEKGNTPAEKHARRLIEVIPVVKDLVDRMGR